jgi:hypothetical protein
MRISTELRQCGIPQLKRSKDDYRLLPAIEQIRIGRRST